MTKLIDRIKNLIFGVDGNALNKNITDANGIVLNKEFLEQSIMRWKSSPEREMQIKGQLYYENEHDILLRKRTMIGADGKLQVVENLPNNRIIDNQYAKLVNQKTNYLLGQPITFECDNEQYVKLLKKVFNKKFMRTLKRSGKYAYNGGIAWLYPYYNETGKLCFRLFPAYEILPFWEDAEHTKLQAAVRLYLVIAYEKKVPVIIEKVEVFDTQGVHCYILDGATLISDPTVEEQDSYYITTGKEDKKQGFNWTRIPLIPLKYNDSEIPLLKKVKTLQDGINIMLSDFENNMQEDARNTILVLKNYDGTDLGEFRRNLATYGAVKVRYDDSTKGGVETLEIQVNAENYKTIVEIFKKALIENGMGYDAKDERMSGTPNQMNIQSMYSDIDVDANDTETEYQAAFEEILWFVNADLANRGLGNFENEEVNVIFNRDILINESEAIDNCKNSVGIISNKSIIANHPWIDDINAEIKQMEIESQEEQEKSQVYAEAFSNKQNPESKKDDAK